MSRGIFIALEGIEGSGKSTQARLLVDWLQAQGVPCLGVREPGGVPVAESIRLLLLEGEDVPARSELLLVLAARAALVEECIRPALEAGQVIVADRFDLSTLAYQAHGRGLPESEVRRLNAFATDGVRPDLTLLLDVSETESERRRAAGGSPADRIEQAGHAFHHRVADAYRGLARGEPDVLVIDGARPADVVQRAILDALHGRFPETFPPA